MRIVSWEGMKIAVLNKFNNRSETTETGSRTNSFLQQSHFPARFVSKTLSEAGDICWFHAPHIISVYWHYFTLLWGLAVSQHRSTSCHSFLTSIPRIWIKMLLPVLSFLPPCNSTHFTAFISTSLLAFATDRIFRGLTCTFDVQQQINRKIHPSSTGETPVSIKTDETTRRLSWWSWSFDF